MLFGVCFCLSLPFTALWIWLNVLDKSNLLTHLFMNITFYQYNVDFLEIPAEKCKDEAARLSGYCMNKQANQQTDEDFVV